MTTKWLPRQHHYVTSKLQKYNDYKIAAGDMVLVHDDGPHVQWRLAVVEDLIHGGDSLVRAANIRTSTGRTNRPIVRLIPLEVSAQNKDSVCSDSNRLSSAHSTSSDQADVSGEVIEPRPVRTTFHSFIISVFLELLSPSWSNQLFFIRLNHVSRIKCTCM